MNYRSQLDWKEKIGNEHLSAQFMHADNAYQYVHLSLSILHEQLEEKTL
jgi:hypothetical protein